MLQATHYSGQRVCASRSMPAGARLLLGLFVAFRLLLGEAAAQRSAAAPEQKQENTADERAKPSASNRLSRLPIEWIIGPYVPPQGPLEPLTNSERKQIYVRQTFLTAGSYVARAFSAGIDQARGVPHGWGGGMPGYGRRYAARYGQFIVQSSLLSGGNALMGYEPRYDFCRCQSFWPRTRHAVSRNFVAYNRTERELRPQIPMYVAAFAAGLLRSSWLPGRQNLWRTGLYSILSQAGIGSGYNFVSEFSLDILHAFGLKKVGKKL
ncbi:MAG: hypothetical protein JOZ14_07875 [Acidobacteria bacterium]|nr:hypothetical protein [Acidobacteriota bacterium]